MGRHRPGVAEIRVRLSVSPLHLEGNRIGLGNWLLTSRPGHGVGGFESPTFRFGSMVKRTSCLASNEMFQVQILVGLLDQYGRATRLATGPGWKPVELNKP